jgi:serine/threonine protein kinase
VSLENLMATPLVDGERVHVTLLDLGMAKDLRPYVSPPVLRGKPPYLAPEAVLGHSPLDPGALDVWALGVVLYILLTSCPLYSTPDHPAFAMLCPQPTGR